MRRVLGSTLDGANNVELIIGRSEIPILGMKYGDNLEIEKVRIVGHQAIEATTDGTYQTEDGSIKMLSDVFRSQLLVALPNNGFGLLRSPACVSYEQVELGADSDALAGLRILGLSAAIEASNKALEVEFKIAYTQVYWGDLRKTINQLNPFQGIGVSTL